MAVAPFVLGNAASYGNLFFVVPYFSNVSNNPDKILDTFLCCISVTLSYF